MENSTQRSLFDPPEPEYCTAVHDGFSVIYDADGQTDEWVHAPCRRPSEDQWYDWRRKCQEPGCTTWFSSPLESKCQEHSPNDPWQGWAWIADQSDKVWHPKYHRFRPAETVDVDPSIL